MSTTHKPSRHKASQPACPDKPIIFLNRFRFNADRGSQYTSNDYLDFCMKHQLLPSVGRTGICYDNAVAESFWASLKRECIQGRVFATRAEARRGSDAEVSLPFWNRSNHSFDPFRRVTPIRRPG